MSVQEDKSNVYQNVGVFKVISGLPKKNNRTNIDSVNSKSNNLLPFLLDLLTSSCLDNAETPQSQLRCKMGGVVIEIVKEALPKIKNKLKESLVKAIKAGIICGSDFKIPNPTPELTLEVDNIDFSGMLKTDNSEISSLLFSDDNNGKDLNRVFKDVITTGNSGVWIDNNGKELIKIDLEQGNTQNGNPKLKLKISDVRAGDNFHDFLIDYVSSIKLFSTKTLMSNLMDGLFGLVSSQNDLSADKIMDKLKLGKVIDKVLDSDFTEETTPIDETFFEFTNVELNDMEIRSNNLSRGVNVIDLGCDIVEMTSPNETVSLLLDMQVSNPVKVDSLLEETLNSLYNNVSEQSGEDSSVIKNNFSFNILKDMPKLIMGLVLSPKVVSLYQISNKVVNQAIVSVKSGFDFSKVTKTFFKIMVREILSIFIEIIFNRVKKELISLITKVVTKIIKEKLGLFLAAVSSVLLSNGKRIKNTVDTYKN